MSVDDVVSLDQAADPEFAEHERTYKIFLRIIFGAAITALVVLALLAYFLWY